VRFTEHHSLAEALSLNPQELLAAVGGGGKTSALKLLAQESSGRGTQVIVTTTTAMLLGDLEVLGPVVVESSRSALWARLDAALVEDGRVCVAGGLGEDGKVMGLPAEWVDELWAARLADYLLVEADGSRGMPLKAFGVREPQVPSAATIIVQVAGLDVLGAPLAEPHVHRAGLLAAALGLPVGAVVNQEVLVNALRGQLRLLSRRWPAARLVTLLNKAEDSAARGAGMELATELLKTFGRGEDRPSRNAAVVGSLRERDFVRVSSRGDG
jgi:probable selenium-dependent hydroxylase accessory protein YqeC